MGQLWTDQIDHLVLELPGLSEPEARHLAWLVSEAVRSMDAPAAALALEHLEATARATPRTPPDRPR
jgi:hypothetical protein